MICPVRSSTYPPPRCYLVPSSNRKPGSGIGFHDFMPRDLVSVPCDYMNVPETGLRAWPLPTSHRCKADKQRLSLESVRYEAGESPMRLGRWSAAGQVLLDIRVGSDVRGVSLKLHMRQIRDASYLGNIYIMSLWNYVGRDGLTIGTAVSSSSFSIST